MAKIDYSTMDKEQLLKVIENLEKKIKKRKCGIVWDYEKVPEKVVIDCETNATILKNIENKDIVLNDSNDNVLIIGENYLSLQCLSYTHFGAFDVIYIDPPYNTLKEGFMYNDKMVDSEDSYRHSKWLNFMEKRLILAKKLLATNGIICISIDDNEYAQLKLLCDQIFKEENLLDVFHLQVRYTDKSLNEKDHFQKVMEYVLVYAQNKKTFIPNKPAEEYTLDSFNLEIHELKKGTEVEIGDRKVTIFKKGEWKISKKKVGNIKLLKETWVTGRIYAGTGHGKVYQQVVEPRLELDGYGCLYKVEGLGEDGLGFRYFSGPQRVNAKKGKMYAGVPVYRVKELEEEGTSIKYRPIVNYYDFAADFGNIKNEGGVNFPGGKKPIKMLKQLINMHPNKNAMVLDFFAGSGSTGHAVLSLNSEDGGNRRFVLCTNNEVKPSEIQAYCKKNNITMRDYFTLVHKKNKKVLSFIDENGLVNKYTYPRLHNVICGYTTDKEKKIEGFTSNLKVYESDIIPIKNINSITDNDRINMTLKAGELISLKENTFVLIETNKWYQIYKDRTGEKMSAIYFKENLEEFDTLIDKIGDKVCCLYVYSSGKLDKEIFNYLPSNIIVKDIPEPILEIYAQINKCVRR